MKSTSSDELDVLTIYSKNNGSATNWARAIVVLNKNFPCEVSETSRKNVCTVTLEIVMNAVESGVMTTHGSTNSIALVGCALPASVDTDALVAISLNSRSWGIFLVAEFAWAFTSLKTLAIMEISSSRAMATINAVVIITVVLLSPTGLWTAGSTCFKDLANWTLHFASSRATPIYMNVVSSTFSEVSRHRITDPLFGVISRGEANVLFAWLKVWSWVDSVLALSIQKIWAKHDSLSSLSGRNFILDAAISFLSGVKAVLIDLPAVSKKRDCLHESTGSCLEIVALVSVENAAETRSLAHHTLIHSEEDRFSTVPLEIPAIDGLSDNNVVANSLDREIVNHSWKRNSFAGSGVDSWLAILV
jgi:hypothetical protein